MEVPLLGARPAGHQPENWLLDPRLYWKKIGIHSLRDLPALVDPVHPLWLDGFSTYHGINDRIPVGMASEAGDSLRLISVNKIELRVLAPGEAFGNSKRRVQGRFIHADQR